MKDTSNIEQTEIERRGRLVLSTLSIVLVLVVISFLTSILPILVSGLQLPAPSLPFVPFIPLVIITIFASALIILVRLGRPTLGALALIGGWTIVTTFTALQSGVTGYSPALLVLPICAAGLLFDRFASISLAIIAALLVGGVAWLEAHGMLINRNVPPVIQQALQANQYFIAAGFWVGVFGAIAALTSLLAGGLQQALRRSTAQAEALRTLSNELESRVVAQTSVLLNQERQSAMLEERTRLAREIHDTIAQGLAGVTVQLGAAQRALEVAPADAHEHLSLAQQLARDSLAEARRSVWNLRAAALDHGSLTDALRSMVETAATSPIRRSYTETGEPWPLTPAAEGALLRVAQEGLANATKHASATEISITLAFHPHAVTLSICDNGVGFAPHLLEEQPVPQLWGGFGLLGMRERLAALDGGLVLQNTPSAMVTATIPRSTAYDPNHRR